MSKMIKKPTQTKKRKPLLIVSESASMALTGMPRTALGYDVIVLPPGVSAYVSVTQ